MLADVQRPMDTIIRAPEAAVIRIVKEFYSILKTTEKDKLDCLVRFRGLGDLDFINALCGMSSYDGSVICERQVEWTLTMNGIHHKHFPFTFFIY